MGSRKVLITGGAGFIGANAAVAFAEAGWDVAILDNLSRKGARENLRWLNEDRPIGRKLFQVDIRNFEDTRSAIEEFRPDGILHLAAQVAVTTSVRDPREDFESNALGTFNLLEAMRASETAAWLIYSSTNKVYGALEGDAVVLGSGRWQYADRPDGIGEDEPLDFHSPYGCSKGSADQYVRDYNRIFGTPTVVLRQSCIYGPRQYGIEDQGWVAWFTIAAVLDKTITIYGDGMQVRDVLHVDDLTRLYLEIAAAPARAAGQIFNVGGGPRYTLSLHELLAMLRDLTGKKLEPAYGEQRPGDQKVFVANIEKLSRVLGWQPSIDPGAGVRDLWSWITANRGRIEQLEL